MRRFILLALLSLGFVVTNCGSESSSSSSSAPATDELTGTWSLACTIAGTKSLKVDLIISGGTFTNTIYSYDNTTCAGDATKLSRVFSYTIGAAVTNGTALDLTVVSCDPTTICTKDKVEYELYKITDNKIYFGEKDGEVDGSTAAKRYTTLSTTAFTKQ